MTNGLEQFVVIAFLVEAIGNIMLKIYVPPTDNTVRPWYQAIDWKLLLSIVIGVTVAFGFNLDLMAVLGFNAAQWFGVLLTGLLISRGSNFVHDLGQFINNLKQKAAVETPSVTNNIANRS